MPPDFFLNCATALSQSAADKSEVNFFDRARFELRGQSAMGFVVLRHNQTTARFFIQSMHDAGPFFSTDSGQLWKMMKKSIHQRPFALTRARMNNQPRRLIDYD